tara:strand:+ start:668 stop:895 length:228 start_codon:yes stop_codon:yes gene_type:complete
MVEYRAGINRDGDICSLDTHEVTYIMIGVHRFVAGRLEVLGTAGDHQAALDRAMQCWKQVTGSGEWPAIQPHQPR